jgi:hypothetical protein
VLQQADADPVSVVELTKDDERLTVVEAEGVDADEIIDTTHELGNTLGELVLRTGEPRWSARR